MIETSTQSYRHNPTEIAIKHFIVFRNTLLSILIFILTLNPTFGQVTINFDTDANWTAGSGGIGSYQTDHEYQESNWLFTGGDALRNGNSNTDGFPGALGTYSWRLRNNTSVVWTGTYTAALAVDEQFVDFGFAVRRWDDNPSPNFLVEYSFDGGMSWTTATSVGSSGVIDNNGLGNSSDWSTFTQTISSPTGLAANQFIVRFSANGTTERIMIDDFSFNIQNVSIASFTVSPTVLENLDYVQGFGPSSPQSFELSGTSLDGSNVTVSAPIDFEIAETSSGPYTSSINFLSYDGTAETIYVRLSSGLPLGIYTDNVTISGGGASDVTVNVVGEVTPAPPSLTAFNDPYEESFAGFNSAATIPGGWSVSNSAYQGDWGSGTAAGLRGNDSVLGFQHTGSTGVFTATLEVLNDIGSDIETLFVKYTGRVERVGEGRCPEWTVEVNGVEQGDLSYSTCSGVDEEKMVTIDFSSSPIPSGATITIEWSSDRGGGSGSSRQIGIADVEVMAIMDTPEITYANLQWPPNGTIEIGDNFDVFAQVYIEGVTDSPGQGADVQAWIGYSTSDTDPSTWTDWVVASYNTDVGNNDEYMANIGPEFTMDGTYFYASRFQYDGGDFEYGGYSPTGGGFWDGVDNVSGELTVNEVAPEFEITYANLQWPPNGTIEIGDNFDVFAQVYIEGLTDNPGQGADVQAWIGYSTSDTDPSTWTDWVVASYNTDVGNNDEYMANIGPEFTMDGTYYYASRFQYDGGDFEYGGYSPTGGGFWDGVDNVSGELMVEPTAAPDAPDPGGPYEVCDGETAIITPSGSPIGIYSFYDDNPLTGGVLLNMIPSPTFETDPLSIDDSPVSIWITYEDGGMTSLPAEAIITVNPIPPPPFAEDLIDCGVEFPSTEAIGEPGAVFFWYEDEDLTSEVTSPIIFGSNNQFFSGSGPNGTFYITQEVDGCESEAYAVVIDKRPPLQAPSIPSISPICDGESVTITPDNNGFQFSNAITWPFDAESAEPVIDEEDFIDGQPAVGGPGIGTPSFVVNCGGGAGSNAFNANGWNVPTLNDAIDQDKYFQFIATPTTSGSLTGLSFDTRRSGTGPEEFAVYVNGEFVFSGLNPTTTACENRASGAINIEFEANEVLDLRIYAWNTTNSGGTLRVDNVTMDLTVNVLFWQFDFYDDDPFFGGNLLAENEISYDTGPLSADESPYSFYVVRKNDIDCESSPTEVIVNVDPIPEPPIVEGYSICTGESYSPVEAIGEMGASFSWFIDESLTNEVDPSLVSGTANEIFTPDADGTYYVIQSQSECESLPSSFNIQTIQLSPPPVVATSMTVCDGSTVTITPEGETSDVLNGVLWNFDGSSPSPQIIDNALVSASDVNTGSGVNFTGFVTDCSGDGASNAYNTNGWDVPSLGDAINQDKYIEVSLTPTTDGFVDEIGFASRISGTGPTNFAVYLDGSEVFNGITPGGSACTSHTSGSINLPFSANTTLVLRIYAWGSTNPSGTFRVDDIDISLNNAINTSIFNFYDDDPEMGGNLLAGGVPSYTSDPLNAMDSPISIWVESGSGDCSETSEVVIEVLEAPLPPQASGYTVCGNDPLESITALGEQGNLITWYYDEDLTEEVESEFISGPFNQTLSPNTIGTYYVTQSNENCESEAAAVTISVSQLLPSPILSDIEGCDGISTTIIPEPFQDIENTFNWSFTNGINDPGQSSNTSIASDAPVQSTGIGLGSVGAQGAGSGCSNAITANNIDPSSSSFTSAVAEGDYFEFCIGDVNPSFLLEGITEIEWSHRRSNTGPGNWALVATDDLSNPLAQGDNVGTSCNAVTVSLSEGTTNSCYRIYYWNSTSTGGTIRIENVNITSTYTLDANVFFNFYDNDPGQGPAFLVGVGPFYTPSIDPSNDPQIFWVTTVDPISGCESTASPVSVTVYPIPDTPEFPDGYTVCLSDEIIVQPANENAGVQGEAIWPFNNFNTSGITTNEDIILTMPAVKGSGTGAATFVSNCGGFETGTSAWNINGWDVNTLQEAIDTDRYFEFPFEVGNEGVQINSISFKQRRSGSGPQNYAVFLNGEEIAVGTNSDLSGTACDEEVLLLCGDMIDANSSNSIRIYAWGASASGGTLRVDDITVDVQTGLLFNFYDDNPDLGGNLLAGPVGSYNAGELDPGSYAYFISSVSSCCESEAIQVDVLVEACCELIVECPEDADILCNDDISPVNTGEVVILEACGATNVMFSDEIVAGSGCSAGTSNIIRTFVISDEEGNSSSCVQNITVNEGPLSVNCSDFGLDDIVLTCLDDVPFPERLTTEICGEMITARVSDSDFIESGCSNEGQIIRTYTFVSPCGQSTSCTQNIFIVEEEIGLECADFDLEDIQVSCDEDLPAPLYLTYEVCGGTFSASVDDSDIIQGNCSQEYSFVRTYSFVTDCGQELSCSQIIEVVDDIGPSIAECGDRDLVAECNAAENEAFANAWNSENIDALLECAVDNCSDVLMVDSDFDWDNYVPDCGSSGSITVNYTVIDNCGNASSEFAATLVFEDTSSPTVEWTNPLYDGIENGGTIDVQCFASDDNWDVPEGSVQDVLTVDVCSNEVSIVYTESVDHVGDCSDDGYFYRLKRNWVVTDECGNSDSLFLFINVVDTIPPVLSGVPIDLTIGCTELPDLPVIGQCNDTGMGVVAASDECECAGVSFEEETVGDPCDQKEYDILRIWTAVDNCGNVSRDTQRITVVRDAALELTIDHPILSQVEPGGTVDFTCDGTDDLPQWLFLLDEGSVDVNNACYGSSTQVDFGLFDVSETGSCEELGYSTRYQVVWTARDECGYSQQLWYYINIVNKSAPIVEGPDVACDLANAQIEASSLCSDQLDISFVDREEASICNNGLDQVRYWTVIDDCGNATQFAQRIVSPEGEFSTMLNNAVLENTNNGELEVECSALFTAEDVTFIGVCSDQLNTSFTRDIIQQGVCSEDGFISRERLTWSAVDICGEVYTLEVLVTFVDTTPPELLTPPAEIRIACQEEWSPTVIDNCEDDPIVELIEEEVIQGEDCDQSLVLRRTYRATDQCGNSAERQYMITVLVDEGIVFQGLSDVLYCPDEMEDVIAIDLCTGEEVQTVTSDVIKESDCSTGTVIERTWTATNDCGLKASRTQIIYLFDDSSPRLTFSHPLYPDDLESGSILYVECFDDNPEMALAAAITEENIVVHNECFADVTMVWEDLGLADCKREGFIRSERYKWMAVDGCGNESEFVLEVRTTDSQSPAFVNPPQDVTLYCAEPDPFVPLEITDNCGQVEQTLEENRLEETPRSIVFERVWTATDQCGNQISHKQVISYFKDSEFNCTIVGNPFPVCNSKGNVLQVNVNGGNPGLQYSWEVTGGACEIISGQGTPVIEYLIGLSSANIRVTVTDRNGCLSVCDIDLRCVPEPAFDDQVQFLSGEELEVIATYPNPASNEVWVDYEVAKTTNIRIQILNPLTGQSLMHEAMSVNRGGHQSRLNISNLPSGSYILEVQNEDTGHSHQSVLTKF